MKSSIRTVSDEIAAAWSRAPVWAALLGAFVAVCALFAIPLALGYYVVAWVFGG